VKYCEKVGTKGSRLQKPLHSVAAQSVAKISRREFLLSAAAVAAVTCVPVASAQEKQRRSATYLDLAKFIPPGHDEFQGEQEAAQIQQWLERAFEARELPLSVTATGVSPCAGSYQPIAADLEQAVFEPGQKDLQAGWRAWIQSLGEVRRAQFFLLPDNLVRYEVASGRSGRMEYRVGAWKLTWQNERIDSFSPVEEHVAKAPEPWFRDVTAGVLSQSDTLREQFRCGVPYWRARLDPASGIDIYGSNGIAVGDIDNDGADEIYVCQPGGLPNRLLKIHPDGSVTDLSRSWGVDLLDDTASALFLDLRNSGRQDLVVLRSSGPVLFLHDDNRYRMRRDAFQFATVPRGGFTGMAAADFDRDGAVDLYLCCYVYFQTEAQYTYPAPYHDARNGPPNFLFRNKLRADGNGFFEDCTAETGINENNDRFSFASAWCDYNGDGWPDLYVANDFGRKNLYRNEKGHFRDVAGECGADDIGPGMSASWFDYDGDGKPDLYVANMWTDAGQRVSRDAKFVPARANAEAYRSHTMGNSLLRNRGDGTFEDVSEREHVAFGRWAWASGGHDLDNDGRAEIFVTCGMLTNASKTDLNGFFWREVVARSPEKQEPSTAYESGWNAINQFIREDYSWNGREPNVLHARRGERFFEFSGVSGLDVADDSRAFAVLDFDKDGRPDVVLKSRLGPQIRLMQNNCAGENHAIAFRLRGTRSNRDAIGARVAVDGQTKWLEAGSGFLSQHSKTLLFGMGKASVARTVRITWPSGLEQTFSNLNTGHTYSVVEGEDVIEPEPFRPSKPWKEGALAGNNEMRLHDTWFMEPVPLPEKQKGPALFVVKQPSKEYEVFRRYLFDWRTSLATPLPLLLNETGEVVKVYGDMPSSEQVDRDLARLRQFSRDWGLPFEGIYLKEPKRDFFKFGAPLLWAGCAEAALPYLERALAQSPDNARILILIGQIHLEKERLDTAEQYFTKAMVLNPNSVPALLGLGAVADTRGRAREAAEFYRKALALDSSSPDAANGLGLSLAKSGEAEEARKYFEQAIALRRDFADAINNLGVLYTKQGKMNDAVEAFSYGIRVAPDDDILYLNLGRAFIRMGNVERARAVMQQLLDRKPDNQIARHALQELSGR
jgi:tetratricopeptide (TPR) repeat protein